MEIRDLYRDVILDHNRSPRNFGRLDPADASAVGHNPLCGDALSVTLRLEGDRLSDLRFNGQGCAISIASASLMGEAVRGKSLAEVDALYREVHALLTETAYVPSAPLGKLMALGGVREYPARVKCASLCWHTLQAALHPAAGRRRASFGLDRKPMSGYENEPVTLSRDVEAVIVPAGTPMTLKAGLSGFITQALGGSFTLYIEGNLYRIPGAQADAIGKEVAQAPELPPGATDKDVQELAWAQMRRCYDPEIPVNIVDLGLVYECNVSAREDGTRRLSVNMTLTAPGCGMGEVLVRDVREKLEAIPTVSEADVQLVFDPPWNQSMMSEAAKLQTGMMW